MLLLLLLLLLYLRLFLVQAVCPRVVHAQHQSLKFAHDIYGCFGIPGVGFRPPSAKQG